MKARFVAASAAAQIRSFCRQPAATFLLLLPLVLTISGLVSALAQSQRTATPAPSPSPTPAEKLSPEIPPATGSIKGRVVADDGRPIVNATLMLQAVNTAPS